MLDAETVTIEAAGVASQAVAKLLPKLVLLAALLSVAAAGVETVTEAVTPVASSLRRLDDGTMHPLPSDLHTCVILTSVDFTPDPKPAAVACFSAFWSTGFWKLLGSETEPNVMATFSKATGYKLLARRIGQ